MIGMPRAAIITAASLDCDKHTQAHTHAHAIVGVLKDYSLQRQRLPWLTSCLFFARDIHTHTRHMCAHTLVSSDLTPAATAYWMAVSLWRCMYCGYCYSNDWLKQQYGNQGRWSLCLQIIRLSMLYTHRLVTVRGLPSQIAHNAHVYAGLCVIFYECVLKGKRQRESSSRRGGRWGLILYV